MINHFISSLIFALTHIIMHMWHLGKIIRLIGAQTYLQNLNILEEIRKFQLESSFLAFFSSSFFFFSLFSLSFFLLFLPSPLHEIGLFVRLKWGSRSLLIFSQSCGKELGQMDQWYHAIFKPNGPILFFQLLAILDQSYWVLYCQLGLLINLLYGRPWLAFLGYLTWSNLCSIS